MGEGMTIELLVLIKIICVHYIADFIFQSDKMATKKSSSFKWLFIHCLAYFSVLFLFFSFKFSLVNASLHFLIDMVTSRICKYYYENNKRHAFFNTIGLDQVLHLVCLLVTYVWLN